MTEHLLTEEKHLVLDETGVDPMSTDASIVVLMNRAMNEVRAVGKDSRNLEQNYNFRGIDAVVNAASPVFRKHGIIPVPELRTASYRDVTTSRGKPSREVTVEVAYHFFGPRGDCLTAVVPGESMDTGDKGTAKAMSVAFRIVLLQILALPTTDADPDSFSPERAYRDETPQPKPAPPSDEQQTAFDTAAREIAACESLEALRKLWPEIVKRNETGVIHNDHCSALVDARDSAARELQTGAE